MPRGRSRRRAARGALRSRGGGGTRVAAAARDASALHGSLAVGRPRFSEGREAAPEGAVQAFGVVLVGGTGVLEDALGDQVRRSRGSPARSGRRSPGWPSGRPWRSRGPGRCAGCRRRTRSPTSRPPGLDAEVDELASLEMPSPYMMSNSTCLNGGATLFLTTLTRVWLPTTSSRSLIAPMRRMSRRTEA